MKFLGSFMPIPPLVVAFGLLACAQSESGLLKAIEESARAAIATTNPIVVISSVTEFAWDRLYIFAPYTPVETIHTQLGFEWSEAEQTNIDSSETFHLLVFEKNSNVVRYVKFPRTVGDFKGLELKNFFPHGSDRFKVASSSASNATPFIFSAIPNTN